MFVVPPPPPPPITVKTPSVTSNVFVSNDVNGLFSI